MEDFAIRVPQGSRKQRKRIGRGRGSGRGGTAGKGNKGQKARSGGGVRLGFEGGQMPLYRRIPRRGFSNYWFKRHVSEVNVGALQKRCADGEVVTPERMVELGILRNVALPVKVLGNGTLSRKLEVHAHQVSRGARQKIESAGGAVVVVTHESLQRAVPETGQAAESARGRADGGTGRRGSRKGTGPKGKGAAGQRQSPKGTGARKAEEAESNGQ
jgi:large subunit ribosomal protein L15